MFNFQGLVSDVGAIANMLLKSASAVEELFPHSVAGVEDATQAAAKAALVAGVVKAAAGSAGAPDAVVQAVVTVAPDVLQYVTAAKRAFDANPANTQGK